MPRGAAAGVLTTPLATLTGPVGSQLGAAVVGTPLLLSNPSTEVVVGAPGADSSGFAFRR